MKILSYPETRQTFNFDCGANALVSLLVFTGIEEREDRIALLAGTGKSGTSITGVLRVLDYFGLTHEARARMTPANVRTAIDAGQPTLITIQAYRESNRPYRELWDDGHWVVAIGYDERRILFEDPSAFHRTWLADRELAERWHDLDRGHKVRGWGCRLLTAGNYEHEKLSHMD